LIVRITCSDSPDLPIDQVLKRWSQTILNEFQEQSRLANLSVMDKPGKEVYSAMSSLADCVKALNKSNEALLELNQVLQQKVDSVSNKFDGLVQQHAKDKSTISSLHVDNNKLREELRRMSVTHADQTHHLLLTPQGGMRNKRQRGEYCNDMATEDSSSDEEVNERELFDRGEYTKVAEFNPLQWSPIHTYIALSTTFEATNSRRIIYGGFPPSSPINSAGQYETV